MLKSSFLMFIKRGEMVFDIISLPHRFNPKTWLTKVSFLWLTHFSLLFLPLAPVNPPRPRYSRDVCLLLRWGVARPGELSWVPTFSLSMLRTFPTLQASSLVWKKILLFSKHHQMAPHTADCLLQVFFVIRPGGRRQGGLWESLPSFSSSRWLWPR